MPSSNSFSASSRSRSSASSRRTMASRRSSCLLNSGINVSVRYPQAEILAGRQLGDALQDRALLVPRYRVAAAQHLERAQCIEACAVRGEQCARLLQPMVHGTDKAVARAIEALHDMP